MRRYFQKVGSGLANSGTVYTDAMLTDGSDIYSSYFSYQYQDQNFNVTSYVERWNGLAWVQYPPIQGKQITDLAIYNNELYASAVSYTSTSYIGGVYKFDGISWSNILPGLNGIVRKLAVFNGELVVAGGFTESTSGEYNLLGYDGNSINAFPSLAVTDSIEDLQVINNELWLGGFFNRFTNTDTASVLKLVAGSWERPAVAHKPQLAYSLCTSIFQYNGKIYSIENGNIYEIKNDTAHFVTSSSGARNGAESNGNMYLVNGTYLLYFDGASVAQVAGGTIWCGIYYFRW